MAYEVVDSRAEGRPVHYRLSEDAIRCAIKMIRHGALFVHIYKVKGEIRRLVRVFSPSGPKRGQPIL